MSNAVFPSLPGLKWDVVKAPRWSTKVQQSVGGKEMRASFWSTPIYTWQLTYELLRANALLELQSLLGFFNARQGRFDSFLFSDPSDNNVVAMGFGAGDGATVAFQLQRTLAGPRQDNSWDPTAYPVPTTPRTNPVIFNEDFTNGAWVIGTDIFVTPGMPDPRGGLNACTLTARINGAGISQTLANSVPIAIRAASLWIRRRTGSGAISLANPGNVALSPLAVTSAWQRFSVADLAATSARVISLVMATQGDQVDVFSARIDIGTAATPYTGPTAGAAVAVSPLYWPAQGDGFEPVLDLNFIPGASQIFVTDWQGTQLQYPTLRKNDLLWSRDLTNGAWVKTSITPVKDQVGADGTVNGATKITAFANNGTVTQQFTLASSRRFQSSWVRRLAGSGTIEMTQDGGTTWTPIVVTTDWARVTVPGQTVVNPNCGFRIALSGDAIAVDYLQNEAGPVATSAIATTTAAVTRTDYTLSATGLVTFAVAPLAAQNGFPQAALTWTGFYYWRVRFDLDLAEFNNFMSQLWEAKQIKLVSVKAA